MPFGSIKTTTTASKNDKSATTTSFCAGPGGGGRTTFRPPWVKVDVPEAQPKTTIQIAAPLAEKTTTTVFKDIAKKNGEATPAKFVLSSITKLTSKTTPLVVLPLNDATTRKEAKLQSREIKVPIIAEKPKPVQEPLIKLKSKKTPSPPKSEEDVDDYETETESESEEDSSPPKKAETELNSKFEVISPKERQIVGKRDKSMSCSQKKREENDNDDEEKGETEANFSKRFKLERPKLRHVVVNKQKSFNKITDDFDIIRPALKKVQKVEEEVKETALDAKTEFKDKVLKKLMPIKRDPSKVNGELLE